MPYFTKNDVSECLILQKEGASIVHDAPSLVYVATDKPVSADLVEGIILPR